MRSYFIVGGSSGIGKALVEMLEVLGHRVYATYKDNVQEDRTNVSFRRLDVLNMEAQDFENLPDQLDGLVYCPGSINLKPFHRFKEEDFMEDYRLQAIGAAKIINRVLPKLKSVEQSSIVLFSTVAVQQGFNFHAQVAMSKGAIEGLTRSLAAEFAPRIRVNAIAPSLTDTGLAGRLLSTEEKREALSIKNPMKRIGNVEDVASAAAFLLSDQSSYITGQILSVDGGYSTIK